VAVAVLLIGCPVLQAGTWTWTGLGADDNWSTANNWIPAGPPHSDDSTTLVFDGDNRLTPAQNLLDSFLFGNLVFATHAGSFQLGGVTNAFGQPAWRSLQFSGSNTSLTVSGGGSVTINGALSTPDTAATQTITVASGMLLQVPWIAGGQRRVVVKRGSGLLRVYEPCDGQHYLQNSCNVGPEYSVEDGTVEMGTRADRYVLAGDGSGWQADPVEVKASYSLAVGDGVGGATSAVFRLVGPSQQLTLDNNLAITVNADGLLDFNGVQDWCRNWDDPFHLAVSNGQVRLGGSSLYVRNGRTLELRGGARIDGNGTNALRFYDGATNIVDGMTTCAVLAADAALVRADNVAGVVFQVSGHTGDVAALQVTGHLGAGGAGSHLVKRGAGTMAIGDLTHALRTNRVEEGTLLLNGLSRCGSTAAGAQWLVASNATLGGSGIISNAVVIVQGGTLDPGDAAAATLTIESDLVLTPGAALVFDLTRADPASGRVHDQLVIQKGALTGLTNAALQIDIHDQLDVDGQTFRIICGGGDFTGQSFRTVSLTGRNGRRADVTAGSGYVDVTIRNTLAGTGMLVF
jgi:hypothetical protein